MAKIRCYVYLFRMTDEEVKHPYLVLPNGSEGERLHSISDSNAEIMHTFTGPNTAVIKV
jgi:hypothetical protein